jgi:transcription elongation factor Elf1
MSDAYDNYCLFCGAPVTPDVSRGFFGQRGTVDCSACGERYRLEVQTLPRDHA